jgi:hypothetical protein
MMTKVHAGLVATAFLALSFSPASAQKHCDGHVSANGDCVSAVAAADARRAAVIRSQPKISETAYPVLPTDDAHYRYPNALTTTPGGVTRIGIVPKGD